MIQMSIESDAASQVVSIYTKGIEETAHVAVKLGGEVFEVTEQLIAMLLVKGVWENLIRQEGKLSGKVSLRNLLRKAAEKGQSIHILEIKDKDEFDKVSKELANSGVLFAKAKGGSYNIVFTEDSAALVNRTIENLKLTSIGNDISSDVTSGKVELDKESIALDDDDLQIADSFEDFEESKPKVDLRKDNGEVIESDDIRVTKTFSESMGEESKGKARGCVRYDTRNSREHFQEHRQDEAHRLSDSAVEFPRLHRAELSACVGAAPGRNYAALVRRLARSRRSYHHQEKVGRYNGDRAGRGICAP